MKYFVVDGTFKEDHGVENIELKKIIDEHLKYLEQGFHDGFILVSGPKEGLGGGIIIFKSNSRQEIEDYLSKDPLKTAGIQEYRIVEFKLHKCQNIAKEWFN